MTRYVMAGQQNLLIHGEKTFMTKKYESMIQNNVNRCIIIRFNISLIVAVLIHCGGENKMSILCSSLQCYFLMRS